MIAGASFIEGIQSVGILLVERGAGGSLVELLFPRTIVCFGGVETYPDSEVARGFLVCFFLTITTLVWMRVPRTFRQQRPVLNRVAMGLCAGGMVVVLFAVLDYAYPNSIWGALEFGVRCAEALGLLMVFDLIAWVRRPSSIAQARVTHGR